MTKEVIIRRLSLIKQLYFLGNNQSALPESTSYSAVLTIHDCIDMFMNLVAEKEGITKGLFLMQYFDSIQYLTLKTSVEKINRRRNSLKHQGIIPGRIEIQDTCSVAKLFFEENTKKAFNIDFNEISLLNLISYIDVREFLIEAEKLLEINDNKKAAYEIAKAFFHLMLINESLHRSQIRNPWISTQPEPRLDKGKFYTKAFEPMFEGQEEMLKEVKTIDGYVEVTEGVAAISYRTNAAISYIFQLLRIFSLGLDFKQYNFYISFMPSVMSFNKESKEYQIGVPSNFPESITNGNVKFALDFVSNFAITLQDFKY